MVMHQFELLLCRKIITPELAHLIPGVTKA